MTTRHREYSETDTYHVFARGAGRALLFENEFDCNSFLSLLGRHKDDHRTKILAWCLMGNHYHLIAQAELGELSAFIRAVNRTYALNFNKRYDRAGHLFQGRFGSQAIHCDEQLLCAVRYVHNNPVNAGISSAGEYRWSSFREYSERSSQPTQPTQPTRGMQTNLCDTSLVLDMLGGVSEFDEFHIESDDGEYTFMDTDNPLGLVKTASDSEMLAKATSILGEGWRNELDTITSRSSITRQDREKRNAILRPLRQGGLTIRQIERLTGISRSIIARL